MMAAALIGGLVTTAGQRAQAATSVGGDLDGDGFADLVLGVPGEDIGSVVDAGALTVVYGDATGVDPRRSQSLSAGGRLGGRADTGDRFGQTFAVGDINGDGLSDLVVGAPSDRVGSVSSAGSVTAVHGHVAGLGAGPSTMIAQGAPASGVAETGDHFGASVALGDIDGDGWADAVVGAPGEDVGSSFDPGVIHVVRGSSSGLTARTDQVFSQAGDVAGLVEPGDRFGSALATGDFNADGHIDVAVGVPGEDIGSEANAGAVVLLYGTSEGLSATGSRSMTQGGSLAGEPQADDRFGAAMVAADFNGDGFADLAVGSPGESAGAARGVGLVHVVYGSPRGLTSASHQSFGPADVGNLTGAGSTFGAAMAAGDFDGDGQHDLAVGAPGATVAGSNHAGSVSVLGGGRSGLAIGSARLLTQSGAASGPAEPWDMFGSSLQTLDMNSDGYHELVVTAPGEDIGEVSDAGVANIFYGSTLALALDNDEAIGEYGAIVGVAETGDSLGQVTAPSWLGRLNLYRAQAGLDPVRESAPLSQAARLHADYMVHSDTVTHSEDARLPRFTESGDTAGRRSNVYGSSSPATPDVHAVDGWATAPFHAAGYLTPSLLEVGFASARIDGGSRVAMAAALDIWGAPRDSAEAGGGPYTWPGPGSVVPVSRYVSEYPDPTSHCPGHTGLPVLAFFPDGVAETVASMTSGGQPVDTCVFDAATYVNGESKAQALGRNILDSADAVVVMAMSPLEPGADYCFSVSSGGESVSSYFSVGPNAR